MVTTTDGTKVERGGWDAAPSAGPLPFKLFKVTHPEHQPRYWARCRALYAGGKSLLGMDPVTGQPTDLLRDVFPRHLHEEEYVYSERCRRAYYIPYAGSIIDMIVAELFAERLSMDGDPVPDEFYEDFFEDVSPPGGRVMAFNDLLKYQIRTALLCRRAWTLVDLPRLSEDALPTSLAEQEESGALRAYALPIEPEVVRDWEMTDDGELQWALLAYEHNRRASLGANRDVVRLEYIHYTRTDWTRYAIEYNRKQKPTGPNDEDLVKVEASGTLTTGRVPLVVLDLPEGLWAMGKIESIAAAHLNKTNALAWAEYKNLFPILAFFGQGEDVLNSLSSDPNRATSQTYGSGRIAQFAGQDRLEYVSPDSSAFNAALQDLASLRDEMHRVLHHMALSVDNSVAALQRSAESKQVDTAATAIILKALSQIVERHALGVYEMVGLVRGDEEIEWNVKGMEEFGQVPVDSLLKQAQTLELISIPSATFQRLVKSNLAKTILGQNADEEDLDTIDEELEKNLPNEMYAAGPMGLAMIGNGEAGAEGEEPDEAEGRPVTCPECGAEVPADAKKCPECGAKLPKPQKEEPPEEEAPKGKKGKGKKAPPFGKGKKRGKGKAPAKAE